MKYLMFLIPLFLFVACKQEKTSTAVNEQFGVFKNSDLEKATIYEVNIRQYSEAGTFNAFAKDIPKLKDMGIDILWLMPIYPIGEERRKGGLGSYYSISNYTGFNPEFGTKEDFTNLLKIAHDNEMYLILDWVANHTAFDHPWIEEHPEWYKKDSTGAIVPPVADWADVAGLDYDKIDMHQAMIDEMKWWLTEMDIDGFRCDVADMVPAKFWDNASKQLNAVKPVLMLAEGWEPRHMKKAFDMAYAWEGHHIFNMIAQGKESPSEWKSYMNKMDNMYQKDDILMNFTSNHDENTWNGTVEERLGDAKEIFAVFSYIIPGMPLIYNGQEYGLNKRLEFFEKDLIEQKPSKFYSIYKKLNDLKEKHDALDGGKNAAAYKTIDNTNENIISFERSKNGETIIFIGNFSAKEQKVIPNIKGNYINLLTEKPFDSQMLEGFKLSPWGYYVLIKK